jgi:hypothetical protein
MRLLVAVFAACFAAQAQIPAQDARNINLPDFGIRSIASPSCCLGEG